MCLFKIKVDEDEDDYAAVRERRVYRRRNSDRIALARRVAVPVEPYSVIPPPQPVPDLPRQKPLVIRPATPPADVQFVHVSPRSSSEDSRRGDYVYERREVQYERERRSPDRYHEYRYVGAPEPEYPRERRHSRPRSRSRQRSRSRRRDDRDDDYDETKIHIRRTQYD